MCISTNIWRHVHKHEYTEVANLVASFFFFSSKFAFDSYAYTVHVFSLYFPLVLWLRLLQERECCISHPGTWS